MLRNSQTVQIPERERFLQPYEAPRFFTAFRDERNRDLEHFVWLAIMSGVRRRDILAMRWRDINFQTKVWFVAHHGEKHKTKPTSANAGN